MARRGRSSSGRVTPSGPHSGSPPARGTRQACSRRQGFQGARADALIDLVVDRACLSGIEPLPARSRVASTYHGAALLPGLGTVTSTVGLPTSRRRTGADSRFSPGQRVTPRMSLTTTSSPVSARSKSQSMHHIAILACASTVRPTVVAIWPTTGDAAYGRSTGSRQSVDHFVAHKAQNARRSVAELAVLA